MGEKILTVIAIFGVAKIFAFFIVSLLFAVMVYVINLCCIYFILYSLSAAVLAAISPRRMFFQKNIIICNYLKFNNGKDSIILFLAKDEEERKLELFCFLFVLHFCRNFLP